MNTKKDKKLVTITGGLGFIGYALAKKLQACGQQFRILDNQSNSSISPDKIQELGGEVINGDVRDIEICQQAMSGASAVVHLAAQTNVIRSIEDPFDDLSQNGTGLLNVLEAARRQGLENLVFASSNGVVGSHPPPISENLPTEPISPYACSKLLGESYCRSFHAVYGMKTIVLRFANVYGPGSLKKGSVVAKFIKKAFNGEPLTIYGDGNQTRDFIYIDDIVSAIIQSIDFAKGGEIFCVGTGREISVNQLVARLSPLHKNNFHNELWVRYANARPGEIIRNYSDISKARRELGFNPSMLFEAGIEKTWHWFKQVYKKNIIS